MRFPLSTCFGLLVAIATFVHASHHAETRASAYKVSSHGRYTISHQSDPRGEQPRKSSAPIASEPLPTTLIKVEVGHNGDEQKQKLDTKPLAEMDMLAYHMRHRRLNGPGNCTNVAIAIAEITAWLHACCVHVAKSNGDDRCDGCPHLANELGDLSSKVAELGCLGGGPVAESPAESLESLPAETSEAITITSTISIASTSSIA